MTVTNSSLILRGRTHFGWPWAKRNRKSDTLSADYRKIVLTSREGEIHLGAASVLRIERAKLIPCLRRGILISHRHSKYPGPIGFVPEGVSTKEVLEHLEDCGYWIAE